MSPRSPLFFIATLALARFATAEPGDVFPAQPVIPGHAFNLIDFGAVPDGSTSNTAAFGRAVAAIGAAGGGTLVVPAGAYLTGPVDLCSGINLHLNAGAKILFSTKADDYGAGPGAFRAMMLASGAHDVMISGEGTIDGNGGAWWPAARRFRDEANARGQSHNNVSPRPLMVAFENCRRVRVEGATLENSPEHDLAPIGSEDVTIVGVTIFNPEDTPNTDGIDPSSCRRVLISHCRIDTGDDCIAVKADDKDAGVSEDILVTDCAFLHGHGCSIGSVTSGGLRNMTVRRCTFDGTETGIRLKSFRSFGGLVENVTYTDLRMKNVGQAITISCNYAGTTVDVAGIGDKPEPVTANTPRWRNITIRNVTAKACWQGAGLIQGLPEMPAEEITLDNVTIASPKGLYLADAKGVTLHDVHITVAAGPDVIPGSSVSGLIRD
jgi:polygalacturonase